MLYQSIYLFLGSWQMDPNCNNIEPYFISASQVLVPSGVFQCVLQAVLSCLLFFHIALWHSHHFWMTLFVCRNVALQLLLHPTLIQGIWPICLIWTNSLFVPVFVHFWLIYRLCRIANRVERVCLLCTLPSKTILCGPSLWKWTGS